MPPTPSIEGVPCVAQSKKTHGNILLISNGGEGGGAEEEMGLEGRDSRDERVVRAQLGGEYISRSKRIYFGHSRYPDIS